MGRLLVACEESQAVTIAFRNKGVEAFSCDIQDCSGGHPEWHIKGDVLEVIDYGWDMMIAHPPCTYLSHAGIGWLMKDGVINQERYNKGIEGKDFFLKLYNANIKMICIENPIATKIYNLPEYQQIIQPFYFGDPFKKRTCLWLKNLPCLFATAVTEYRESSNVPGNWYNKGGKERQKNRSKTFPGIANAMAEQWGHFLL